jgi:hypothetical protein
MLFPIDIGIRLRVRHLVQCEYYYVMHTRLGREICEKSEMNCYLAPPGQFLL